MEKTLSKKKYLKTVLVFVLILACFMLTVTALQGDVLTEEGGIERLGDSSARISFLDGYGGYTRTLVIVLVIIAMIIATAYVLSNKYGVRTNIGRNKKYIQIIDHTPMGVKKSVFLVKVPGKHLLLGVTNDRIELLTEIANEDIPDSTIDDVNKKEFLNLVKKSISGWKQG
jgi:flagellar biosynthetic protein FliO